ncbi:MAG: BamA/TamA family outer membrane protein [Deltaproteobacteria bacterium]|nr:BamA/TamA family outer membrane protein [Deltaproteobacteria bacterium]
MRAVDRRRSSSPVPFPGQRHLPRLFPLRLRLRLHLHLQLHRLLLLLLLLLETLAMTWPFSVYGAEPADREPLRLTPPTEFIGRPVARVTFTAPPSEDRDELARLIGIGSGTPYSPGLVRRAVRLLHQLDRFDNIYVRAARVRGQVELEFVLPPRRVVRAIEMGEVRALSATEIESILGLSVGRVLDDRTLADRRKALTEVLRRRGYRSAAVGLATERLDLEGGTKIIVRIDEGPTTVLRTLVIEGAPGVALWKLRSRIAAAPGEVLDLVRLEASLGAVQKYYRGRGFLDARVDEPEVRELDERAQGRPLADVVVRVYAGPRVEIRFRGHRAVSTSWLMSDASVLAESGTGPAGLLEVKERVIARYALLGYYRVRVAPAVRVTADRRKKQILFSIKEGPRGRVASLKFPGSTVFSEEELDECVHDSIVAALGAALDRPGVDPEVVALSMGDRSLRKPRDTPQPSTTPPDPERTWPFQRRRTLVYLEKAYRSAADVVADRYRSRGYQNVRVDRPVVRPRPGGRLLDVSMEIDEGIEWRIDAVAFTGHEAVGGAELLTTSGLEPGEEGGQPLSFTAIEEGRRAILRTYRERGFLYASVGATLRDVPERGRRGGGLSLVETSTAARYSPEVLCRASVARNAPYCPVQVVFSINEGPKVKVGKIVVRGVERTEEALVRDGVILEEGRFLRESDMTTSRANLLRLGVFDRVSVRPLDEDEVLPVKDVLAQVHERTHLSFEVGAGASTEEGIRLFSSFGHANLLGRAIRFQANAKLNLQPNAFLFVYNDLIRDAIRSFYDEFSAFERIERETAVGLSFPRLLGLPRGFSGGVDLSVLRRIEPTFVEDARIMTLIGHYKGLKPTLFGKARPLTLQLRADFDWSDVRCNEALISTENVGRTADLCGADRPLSGTSIYVNAGPRVSFDLRDDPLDPRAGVYAEVETTFAKGLDPGSPDYWKLEGQLNVYLPLSRGGTILAFSLIGRRLFPFGAEEIPINRRYFAGGRSTVRGYPEQSLFPQDTPRDDAGVVLSAVSPGGELLVASKSEIRLPVFSSVSIVGFVDVGDLFIDANRFTLNRKTPMGAGAGVRVATPVGPIAVDVGVPLNPRGDPGEQSWTLHFAIRSF